VTPLPVTLTAAAARASLVQALMMRPSLCRLHPHCQGQHSARVSASRHSSRLGRSRAGRLGQHALRLRQPAAAAAIPVPAAATVMTAAAGTPPAAGRRTAAVRYHHLRRMAKATVTQDVLLQLLLLLLARSSNQHVSLLLSQVRSAAGVGAALLTTISHPCADSCSTSDSWPLLCAQPAPAGATQLSCAERGWAGAQRHLSAWCMRTSKHRVVTNASPVVVQSC
jgi:hypothetical protein